MAWLLALLQVAAMASLPHEAMSLVVPAPRTRASCDGITPDLTRKRQHWRSQKWQLSMVPPPDCQVESEQAVSSQTITASGLIRGMAASALCLLSLARVAGAAEDGYFPATGTDTACISRSRSLLTSTSTLMSAASAADPPTNVADYLGKVFASPNRNDRDGGLFNAAPAPTDPQYDSKEARNRAYDAAFEQDARDRDAYYGRLALEKRRRAEEDVARYRTELGLDGTGDVRPRVGDERVAGMASLREYLLRQDPATLTPEELKVYQRLRQDGEDHPYRQQQEEQAPQKEGL